MTSTFGGPKKREALLSLNEMGPGAGMGLSLKGDISKKIPQDFTVAKYLGFTPLSNCQSPINCTRPQIYGHILLNVSISP